MKRWQETSEIFGRLAKLNAAGQHAAVACVVHISGSAYRRPGARFLISPDGSTIGGISGGCLEEDVRRTGLTAIEDGECRLLHYETGKDDDPLWGLGLGCDGEVDVFVAPTSSPGLGDAIARTSGLFAGDEPFSMVTIIDNDRTDQAALAGRLFVLGPTCDAVGSGDGPGSAPDDDGPSVETEAGDTDLSEALAATHTALAGGKSRIVEIGGVRAFVEVFQPPSHLVVCGAGDDAMPLVASAASAGFRVVVVDHRPAYLTAERFPAARELVQALPEDDAPEIPADADTFVVLKTHNLVRDKAWAQRFAAAPVPYLGLLGPRPRCEEIAAEIAESAAGATGETPGAGDREAKDRADETGTAGNRIFGPVGLDLGAEGPEQVGMAVVAELLAVRSGRRPGHLRDRETPIHEREPSANP